MDAPSVPSRIIRLPEAPGIWITNVSPDLPLKSPALIREDIAPSRDLSRSAALFCSCGPVARMRESALIFYRLAEDAVKSMLAPSLNE